jgi:hypothetical protein
MPTGHWDFEMLKSFRKVQALSLIILAIIIQIAARCNRQCQATGRDKRQPGLWINPRSPWPLFCWGSAKQTGHSMELISVAASDGAWIAQIYGTCAMTDKTFEVAGGTWTNRQRCR